MEEANENWWFTGPFLGRLENFPAAIILGSAKETKKKNKTQKPQELS